MQLLGEGAQGVVYRIDRHRCVKLFHKPQCWARELENLIRTRHESGFPKLYGYGRYYIIRQYIEGMELGQYLKKFPLTQEISLQLLKLLLAFKRLHFKRIDTQLKNVMITPKGKLVPIDLVNATRKKQPYPQFLLAQLDELGLKEQFLNHIEHQNPHLAAKWRQANPPKA